MALDSSGGPVTVSPSKDPNRNIIMWLDHRAIKQAQTINDTKHKVLSYVGGTVSPEMEMPKLLWLKENLPEECWGKSSLFLELPEFLTYRATGEPTRWVERDREQSKKRLQIQHLLQSELISPFSKAPTSTCQFSSLIVT